MAGAARTQISPGVAGVASESTKTAVMIYNEKEKYNEWEFISPLIQQNQNQGGSNQQGGANGQQQGTNADRPGQPPNSPFGQNPIGPRDESTWRRWQWPEAGAGWGQSFWRKCTDHWRTWWSPLGPARKLFLVGGIVASRPEGTPMRSLSLRALPALHPRVLRPSLSGRCA